MTEKEIRIAEILHNKFCNQSHIDQCGWDYESWNNPGYARMRFIEDARFLIKEIEKD